MRSPLRALALALLLLAVPFAPALANGGTVRISRQPVGPYVVSVFSSPTPLRTGAVDISVLIQDSVDAIVPGVPVRVEARPVGAPNATTIAVPATRDAATNKLFQAAKFEVATAGEWEFRVRVGGEEGGVVSFRARVSRTTLLDRPYLLAAIVVLPLLLVGWLMTRRDDEADAGVAG